MASEEEINTTYTSILGVVPVDMDADREASYTLLEGYIVPGAEISGNSPSDIYKRYPYMSENNQKLSPIKSSPLNRTACIFPVYAGVTAEDSAIVNSILRLFEPDDDVRGNSTPKTVPINIKNPSPATSPNDGTPPARVGDTSADTGDVPPIMLGSAVPEFIKEVDRDHVKFINNGWVIDLPPITFNTNQPSSDIENNQGSFTVENPDIISASELQKVKGELDNLIYNLSVSKYSYVSATIIGHTDSTFDIPDAHKQAWDYNLALSARRAKLIGKYITDGIVKKGGTLESNGRPRIQTKGMGMSRPYAGDPVKYKAQVEYPGNTDAEATTSRLEIIEKYNSTDEMRKANRRVEIKIDVSDMPDGAI